MRVGACRLALFLPEVRSLKEKRRILLRVKEKVFHKFHVPVVEVDHHDLWQRAEIGFSVVGRESGRVESSLESMIRRIEEVEGLRVTDREIQVWEI